MGLDQAGFPDEDKNKSGPTPEARQQGNSAREETRDEHEPPGYPVLALQNIDRQKERSAAEKGG